MDSVFAPIAHTRRRVVIHVRGPVAMLDGKVKSVPALILVTPQNADGGQLCQNYRAPVCVSVQAGGQGQYQCFVSDALAINAYSIPIHYAPPMENVHEPTGVYSLDVNAACAC